jgi:hypothetical protein
MHLSAYSPFSLQGMVLFISYSAIIVSFLAGTLWGQSSHQSESKNGLLIIFSNIWAVGAWAALLLQMMFQMSAIALIILMLIYTHIIVVEANHKSETSLSNAVSGYMIMRKGITGIVLLMHASLLLGLAF